MRQDEKDLLLRDLSARLPYGVKLKIQACEEPVTLGSIEIWEDSVFLYLSAPIDINGPQLKLYEVVPYLRPMSSITQEEKKELISEFWGSHTIQDSVDEIDWYLQRHFDVRSLIKRGLAIAVTEENNPYKE